MPALAEAIKVQRVLCLQGKGGDGAGMRQRLQPLQTALGEGWELDCIDAPHDIGHGDRAWWINPPGERSYTASAFEGDDMSIAQVEAAWAASDYSALLGFSQGAMLAAIVGARGILGQGGIQPRCMVLLGAALPKPYEGLLQECSAVSDSAKPVASLHCLSEADTINPPELGKRVADSFKPQSSIVWHSSGHVIPGARGEQDEETVRAIAKFLKEKCNCD